MDCIVGHSGSKLLIEFTGDSNKILRMIADHRKIHYHEVLDEILDLYIRENKEIIKKYTYELSQQECLL